MIATPWAHLPNAVYIDRIIASTRAHPGQWKGADYMAWQAQQQPWPEAYGVVKKQGRCEIWETAWWAASIYSRPAIIALIAYDDCAYMLDSDPGELAILAEFGDPRAILLLGACKALQSIKESA